MRVRRHHPAAFAVVVAPLFAFLGAMLVGAGSVAAAPPAGKELPRIAAIVTAYYHNSHADVLVSRMLQGDHLNYQAPYPKLKLVSLYTDQVAQSDSKLKQDKSRALSKEFGFPIYDTVAGALTLGTDELAVDGVLLIAEHGDYPESATGQIIYPKRRLFGEIVKVFKQSGRVVPVFSDKHLAHNWQDGRWLYDTAQELGVPLMAGSSLPGLWRYPPVDVTRGAKIKEVVATSYHRLDTYGIHALEMVQGLVERRQGGETGIAWVKCLEGEAVWEAGRRGVYDRQLLDAAIAKLKVLPLKPGTDIEKRARKPVLFVIQYRDGLKASILTLDGLLAEWTVAWREEGSDQIRATCFWTQENRPYQHFGFLLQGVEKMMHTGKPTWPVERTLLTTGALDALLISHQQQGKQIRTPELNLNYQSDWNWRQPPPPPPERPHTEQ